MKELNYYMKKTNFYLLALLLIASISVSCNRSKGQVTKLPEPQKGTEKASLMKALQDRHSVRVFQEKDIPEQTLSNLLWAANGVNRSDGKRTAPSAINAQDIELFINKGNSVYHYVAAENTLVKVSDKDIRPIIADQNQFIMKAPVVILLISNQANFEGRKSAPMFGAMDAGLVAQNICLYCSSEGLGTVPCAPHIDAKAVREALDLSEDYLPLIYLPVGYPGE